jgi:tetratricopeptide (TPR) repeat protein
VVKARLQPEFGQRLRAARTRSGLRQTDLACEGLTQSYLSHLESGRREPSPQVVETLARRLSVPAHELLGELAPAQIDVALVLAYADMDRRNGNSGSAQEKYEHVVREATDVRCRRRASLGLALLRERMGDLDAAVRLAEPIVQELLPAEERPDLEVLAEATTSLSRCYREAGDLHRAVDVAEAASKVLSVVKPRPRGYPQLMATLAFAYTDRGDLLRATHILDDLLLEYDQGPDRAARAAAYWNASLVSADRGRIVEALQMIERASFLLGEDEDERALARIKITNAWLLMSQPVPDPARAEALLSAALPDLEKHASVTDLASALTELARAALAMGRARDAAAHAAEAIRLLEAQPNLESARAGAVLGQALLVLGEPERGREQLNRAAAVLTQSGATREAAVLWRQIGQLYQETGAVEQAFDAFQRALDALGVRGELMDLTVDAQLLTPPTSRI